MNAAKNAAKNGTANSPKLLCITKDRRLTRLIDETMLSPGGSNICHVAHINEGVSHLNSDAFDAVLLDSSAAEDDLSVVSDFQHACRQTPLMIATELEQILLGHVGDDVAVVPKSELDSQRLALEVLRMLAARESHLQQAMRANLERLVADAPAVECDIKYTADTLAGCELDATLTAVRNHLPVDTFAAKLTGVSEDQATLQWSRPQALDTELFVMGVAGTAKREFEFYQAIRHQGGQVHLQRLGIDKLFPPADLTPRLQGHFVRLGLPPAFVAAWESAGVLCPEPVDRILVCPRCSAVPALRPGCRSCSSPWVDSQPMIHHFACAYVAPADAFVHQHGLRCPKCLAEELVIGADCEHIPGPNECRQCHWSDTQREMFGRCFECTHVFPAAAAVEQEVIRYDVDRLEPLGLLTTS